MRHPVLEIWSVNIVHALDLDGPHFLYRMTRSTVLGLLERNV